MTTGAFPDLEREAKIFGRFLIGEEVSTAVIGLYLDAHRTIPFELTEEDTRLLKLIYRHPGLTGMIDGGLALQNKGSAIRRKIFTMLAILETFPEYSQHYLFPESVPAKSLVVFFLSGLRGVFRIILGFLLVKIA